MPIRAALHPRHGELGLNVQIREVVVLAVCYLQLYLYRC
jgi:hypothetical protein